MLFLTTDLNVEKNNQKQTWKISGIEILFILTMEFFGLPLNFASERGSFCHIPGAALESESPWGWKDEREWQGTR